MRSLLRDSRRVTIAIAAVAIGMTLTLTGTRLMAASSGQPSSGQSSFERSSSEQPSAPEVAQVLVAEASLIIPGSLKFKPCAENVTLDCGTLLVPVDYRKPFGEHVGIAVIRARATNPAKRIGVVVGNPGGPGISGVDFVLGGINVPAFARLRERFDVVSFDPRGVKRSRPVRCAADFPDPPADPDSADDVMLAAYFDEVGRAFARACFEQNGSWAGKLGTNNVARDMDLLRRALGERQITYAAGSYGSELGAVYASLFPERLRAMMLDGTVTPIHRDYLVEFLSEFSTAFEHSLLRLDQVCRRDPSCALADTGVVAAYDEVASRLRSGPVTSPQGAMLTVDVLSDIFAVLLDREGNWPLIVRALSDARGGDFSIFFQFIPFVTGGDGSTFYAITCNDYGTRRPASDYLPFDEANGAQNPRFFGRFFVANGAALCSAWPAADPPVIRDVRRRMDVPMLIIGNDFDSRTPLSSARRLADMLGMERSLVRYAGGGHTAFAKTTECVQETIENYLFDLRLPAEGFVCPGRVITFAPPTLRQTTDATPFDSASPGLWGPAPLPRVLPARVR